MDTKTLPMFHAILPATVAGNVLLARDSDGSRESRSGIVKQISASNDVDAVTEWLLEFGDSPKTLRAYRREAERFLLYLASMRPSATLKKLLRVDIRAFEAFARQPPPDWVSASKLPRSHPDWRPFAGPLSPGSLRQATLILKALMSWLQAAGYAQTNPFLLDRRRHRRIPASVIRYLSHEAVSDLFRAADALPAATLASQAEKARARLMLTLYYDAALRLFEPVAVTMGAIEHDSLGAWIAVTGKGGKSARVPLSRRAQEALAGYQQALGDISDTTPLLCSSRARGWQVRATEGTIAAAFVRLAKRAAGYAEDAGRNGDAAQLRLATPHWLRHSRISHLVNGGANLQTVRALARHENLETTGVYSHTEAIELQKIVRGLTGTEISIAG